jgi:hypothetical protein
VHSTPRFQPGVHAFEGKSHDQPVIVDLGLVEI